LRLLRTVLDFPLGNEFPFRHPKEIDL
jgi:hypothetical protein